MLQCPPAPHSFYTSPHNSPRLPHIPGRRKGQKCPGYHDASSLIFRDETTRVIDRARTRKTRRTTLPSSQCTSGKLSPASFEQSLVGLRPPALLYNDSASGFTQYDDNDNHPHCLATPHEEEQGKNGKDYNDSVAPACTDVVENLIDNITNDDSPLLPDQMDMLVDGTFTLWEPDQIMPVLLSSSYGKSSTPSLDLDGHVLSMPICSTVPSQSLEELGINYFMANYVLKDSGPCPGVFNYAGNILAGPGGDAELARVAIRAVGLAGLASTTGTDSVMRKAGSSYTEAIKRVNVALLDPRVAENDSAIFTIVVLGLFESITCSGDESLEAWKCHINGAASLLMLRGTSQFRTKQGLQIFGEAVSHVLTLCSRYNQPVPPRLRYLRAEMERNFNSKSPSWILSTIHIEVMNLYIQVQPEHETPFLAGEWETLLSHAAELSQRLENLVADLPVSWRFKTVSDPMANPRLVFHGKYHIYYNVWIAKIWDGMRACRIILNQVVHCLLLREGLAWAPHDISHGGVYTSLLQRTLHTTTEMRDDILASVPQMLGFIQHEATTGASYMDCSTSGIPSRLVPASGAYFIVWYLYLAGSLPSNTPETRDWIVDRLRAIRSKTGIQKAAFLADMIEKDVGRLSAMLPPSDFLLPAH
ncbi:hypothetical protein PDIG_07380 [Penicillium digitatum PHI26]|uniref:Uncharacterized protein n=2 Tax=Penicillium digitatum TaxID=36651 RepID=K9G9X0_PEND2|nr:hypothetical protein PDIP_12020 [Penicillium digitatum Pd1]EKV18765.1 hypothetical protein PDIG_07380 [Penicillium digitatum PHI26]EKV20883.1 hypothetical protein PDIP_12020 [Penicillium digitatum Pd1]